MRLMSCILSEQSPWLNAVEPKWTRGKRKVVEPDGLPGACELAERVCRVFGRPHYEHLSLLRVAGPFGTRGPGHESVGAPLVEVVDGVAYCLRPASEVLGDLRGFLTPGAGKKHL